MLKLQMSNPLPEIEVKIPPAKPALMHKIFGQLVALIVIVQKEIFSIYSRARHYRTKAAQWSSG